MAVTGPTPPLSQRIVPIPAPTDLEEGSHKQAFAEAVVQYSPAMYRP